MNRRNRTLLVVAVAVLVAGLASFGVYRAIRNIPVREVPIATSHAVVAKVAVPVGVILTKDQVQLVPWPAASPVPGGFKSVDDVVGRGVTSSLVPNEPISESKLAPRGSGGGLPPTIPPGMRAMAVRVNDIIGVAGFVTPHTRVDVLVTLKQGEPLSRIVLSNIEVLTSGHTLEQEKSKQGQAMPTSVVTLLVTPHDGERLTLAESQGSIVLALRNPLDTEPAETQGARVSALFAGAATPPVEKVVKGRPRVVAPPPPPAPKVYTVETIRAAKRGNEVID